MPAKPLTGIYRVARIVQNFSHRLKDAVRQFFAPPFDVVSGPFESAGLRAICYQSWPEDPQLIQAWEDLRAAVPDATTFHTPTWQKAVVENLAKSGRLRLIVVHKGHALVGVIPMHMRDDGLLESLGPSVTIWTRSSTLTTKPTSGGSC